jgi:hypothetical protein
VWQGDLVSSAVVAVVVGLSLATALLGLLASARSRPPGRLETAAALLTGTAVIVQSLIAGFRLAGGARPAELSTTVGYLIGIAFVMPIGVAWALAERTRWSGAVLAVAAFTVAVMTARLRMLWGTGG